MSEMEGGAEREGSGIAIVGFAGRFPKAGSLEEFWRNLCEGVESVSFFSDDELETFFQNDPVLAHPNYVKAAAVLDDIESFDASFFGFGAREAEVTDPQHRLFLECAWEALESAGYDPATYDGLIGVYGGVGRNDYLLNVYSNPHIMRSVSPVQLTIGNCADYVTTRVSYKLNLRGPSVNVQTACSTSLVAVHLASQSLINGECDIALAGGVSLNVPQKTGYLYEEGGIDSPDGHCRAYDAKARGTVSGNGGGIVVLKRLSDALADGDSIHAVIIGSAINNDGSLKVGFTAPSIEGQAEVIAEALNIAGVSAETVTYVEGHGTGTALGDPIEIAALTQAYRADTEDKNFCAIGSVKTNIGHLDTGAGVTGLIKTVLALKHKMLPPSLNFEQPNPDIDFANSPFYVNHTLKHWEAGDAPRRAGVSSFGIGGTNAHAVVEEAPATEAQGDTRPYHLLVLSAKTESALETATTNLTGHLKRQPDVELADVAYTLQVGRSSFSHRRAIVCRDIADAVSALESRDPKRLHTLAREAGERSIAFIFSGQGTQYVQMGRELYETEEVFREHVNRCAELLEPHLGFDLRDVLYPDASQAEEAARRLAQTEITQPALFVVEYALARLWMSWGVRPEAMIGHSLGEYVAACVAGVFSLEDALMLVAARGKLMQQLPAGAMLSVNLSEAEIAPYLVGGISLAAVNTPSLCVLSGTSSEIERLQTLLNGRGVTTRLLVTSHAFHSEMMEPILEPFVERLKRVGMKPPKIPFISNVTGTWVKAQEATDPGYWARHLRQTVRFAEGLRELTGDPQWVLLEVGPGNALSTFARQLKPAGQTVLSSLRHPREEESDAAFLLGMLGRLWLAGGAVDWTKFNARVRRQRVPLPTYPFERRRYWIERHQASPDAGARTESASRRPDVDDWCYVPSWKRSMPETTTAAAPAATERRPRHVLFGVDCEAGSALAGSLSREGCEVVSVCAGECFEKLSESLYTLDPLRRDDYLALLDELSMQDMTPDVVVHLWSLDAGGEAQANSSNARRVDGFRSLLCLAQAAGSRQACEPLEIKVVTRSVHDVTGAEELNVEAAALHGLCKVIPQEHASITCRSIDVAPVGQADGGWQSGRLLAQLTAELSATSTDRTVALRGGHRWVQTFEKVSFDGRISSKTLLRDEGAYLLTGGLSQTGMLLAGHLAQASKAGIVFCAGADFPRVETWDEWLANHRTDEEYSRLIRQLQELLAVGAEVAVYTAEVSDESQMRAALEFSRTRFGHVNGVFHVVDDDLQRHPLLGAMEADECQMDVRRTSQETRVLEEVLRGQEMDFCMLVSGLSSVVGGAGRSAASASGHLLAATAQRQRRLSTAAWMSVNCDWRYDDGQHAVNVQPSDDEMAVTPLESVKVFGRVFSLGAATQVVVSPVDLEARIARRTPHEFTADAPQQTLSGALYPRPEMTTAYVAPGGDLEPLIAELWQEKLGVAPIGVNDNFFELGGDSLLVTQIVSQLRDMFQIDLQLSHFFERQTIAELAGGIEAILVAEISELTEEDAQGLLQ